MGRAPMDLALYPPPPNSLGPVSNGGGRSWSVGKLRSRECCGVVRVLRVIVSRRWVEQAKLVVVELAIE